MPGQTKYFISNTNGFFVNWYSDITGVESHGQALKVSGNSGDDAVYVGQGTKVDATGLTSTGGNDSIYLTGTFNNYEQTLDGNTYTFKRTVTIGGTDYQEEVSFTASNGDRVYFANGFFKIDITGNDGLLNAGVFQKIKFADIDSSSITPTDPLTTQPAIDKGIASEVGATKVFISDNDGEHITPGVKGSVFKISGNSGNDTVYVAQGTKVDATGLTSTGGNDVVYLTGTFNEYTKQTVVDSTYTFERTVNINGTGYQEEVSFTASNGDRVYFADGFVKIDITGDDGLLEAGAFKRIESTDIDGSESTPGLGIGLRITDDKSNIVKNGEDITYTFTFDEAVTDFDINDITVTGGTKGTFVSVNGSESVYTLALTPPANSKGIISLTVAVDAATSKVNTALKSVAASNNQSFDTQAPTLIISDDKADALTLKTGDTITYTFTFSEAVTGFDKSVINISNGAIKTGTDLIASTTPADAGKVYTLTVVPSSDLDVGSKLTVSVSANTAITDSVGNAYSTAAANNEQAIDTKAPVAILSGNMTPNANLTMTFLEVVTINTAGSIVIYDKANSDTLITIDIANQVSLDSTKKIITINPGSDLIVNKNYYVKIDAGTFEDTAGNDYEGIDSDSGWGFLVYSFTTTAQWVDASGNSVSDNGINASEFSTLAIQGTLTNSGGATGVTISAITFKAASGTANDKIVDTSNLPTFASADGTEWTLANSKIPTLVSGETYTIEINLSSTGGGTSTGGNATPVLIDTIAPTITDWAVNSPTDGQSGFKVGDVIELTMTTNEALSLSNATSSKVTIGNKEFTLDTRKGAAKAGASVDELKQLFFTYTVKVDDSVSKADFEITSASAIALTGVTDAVGNMVTTTGTYPVELDRNVDGVVPTIGDITLNWGDILNAIEDNSNGTVTVATTGVENNQEVSLVINQKTYTGTVTSNSATITVTATDLQALTHGQTYSYKVNIKDTAGNPAIEKIGDFKVDTVAPTIAITSYVSALKVGETAMITFTLSEVSTDFVAADVTVTGGVLSGFALKSGETKVYTATFTPTVGGSSGAISVANSKFTDAAGNNNADGSDADNSVSLTVDTNDVGAIAAISGTTTQGQTLTAGAITDADGTTGGSSVAATYQWTVSDTENGTYTAISGAIASTFTLTQAEVDKFIKVVASYTDAQGTVETVTSAASSAVDNTNDVGAIAAISGTTTQGQTLAAGAITDADGTTGGSSVAATYQWTVSDTENGTYTAISGAIASTFTLTQAEVDKFIKVVASYTDAQGTVETVTSAASSAVDNTNDVGAIAAISGTTTQGQTLTAGAITDADGTTGGSSVAATYQWTVSDTENGTYTAISGAIASTFTLTQAEVDKFIKVVASYTDAQGTVEIVTSAASSAVDNTNDVGAIAAISGTTTQGQTLTAGAITDADGTTGGSSVAATYQWTVSDTENGTYTAISGAIASTFTLTQAEVDKFIKVVASYTDAQGTVETVTSAASSAVDNTNDVGAIAAISGTTTQGQTLTAGAITDADGTTGGSSVAATYQWTVSDTENGTYTAISGAIASTFTLTQAEVDKFIKVVASYTDAQGTVETVTSAASSAVDNTNDVGAIAAISGTTTQGQTLTAGAITDADGTTGGSSVAATYQWTVSDTENGTYTAISGAIASTFTLTQAEVDKFIKVVASYTDAQGTVETVTSAASSAVDNTNDVGAIAAISGTTTQGQTLTAGAITDADGTTGGSSVAATYQWTVSDTENGTYTAISGAIASTFTLTQAEVDKFIKVVASYTDAQGTVEIVTSAASSAVDNTNDVGAIAAISGTTTQGQTLAAGAITDADGTTGGSSVAATYQWTVSDTENGTYTAISGAIASTFTLTQAEVDKFIKVVASYTDAQGTVEIVTSAASSAVDNTNDVGAIAAISGTTTQGQTLTAGAITDADGTTGGSSVAATYQWTVSDTENGTYTAISGAIASTFTLTQAEVDKFIKVVASYTDAQGTVEIVTSAASSAVDNTNDVGAIAAISGTTTQGQTLAAGAITDADGTTGGSSVAATYQWTVSDTENGTYTAISGAIASTFTLTQAEVDKFIKVVASYTDAQGTVETVTSAASSAVDNTNDVGAIAAISGTTTQGQTLTAGAITDADGTTGGSSVAATYQWTVSDTENGTYTAISGAIASTFTLTQAEVDKFIKVVASYTDAQGTVETVTSAASSAVDNTNDVGAIAAISGTTTQGQTLTAGAITDADGTTGGSSVAATYQWTVSDTENGTYTAISGAIASTFTLTQAEVDKFIKVVASYTDAQGTVETVTSAASSAVDNTNDVGAIAAISGTTTQGQTLTAGAITDADGTTGGSSVAATYQWTVSDTENGTYTAISGAIASTFTLTQAEVDKFIKVVASYTDAQGTVETVTSAASSAVDNTNDVGAIAAISGTTTQGQTLTAGAITDADGTTGGSSVAATYQWTVSDTENGTYTAISGAIASTFTLTQAEVDKFIKVVASYTDAQGTVETVTSAASSAVDNTNDVGAIAAISGTTTQGQTLAAGAITDADGTTGGSSVAATYQWTVSDTENGTYTAISGAIASTFTLTQAEVDKFIKVVASYTDAQGTVETVTSAASSAVDNTNDVGAIAAISGTTTQGQTLTAGAITDADGTTGGSSVAATYQWTVSDTENGTYTAISGAIASTFTLTQAEVDKFIKVVASYTDAQGTVEIVTSAASSAVDNTNDVGAIAAISGTTTQGQTLTAGAITDADGTTGGSSVAATYQWTVSDTENGTYTAISGAIASTFTLTQAEVDKFIKVVASYTDAQGTVETVTSAASSAVDNTNDVGAIAAISGTTTQGQTLTAGAITDADGTTGGSSVAATYQWTVSDTENGTYTAISGAIASTFTLTQAEVDKFIKVVASYTDAQGTVETVTSAASSAVDNTNDVGAIAAISGTTTQGQTLTAGAITDADGTTGGSSVAATYQWTVSDTENGTYTAISGAIASTFTLTQAEVDKFIKVVASYTDAQGTVETVTSAASSAVDNTNDVGAIAAISGTTTQGQTLTAGAITDADGTTGGSSVAATYQWTVSDTENGTYTAISGAIASTFTLTQAEVDKFIKVVASYTDAQGTVETVTSAASSAVDNTNDVGAIAAISGTTTQGQTLTAGAITDADGTTGGSSVAATYQWTVSDTENGTYTAISGAIASTFTLTQAEVDKFIKVVASYTDAQGTVETVTSAASSAVDNTNDVGAIAAISGTTTQGQTLAAGAITDADGTTGGSSVAATYQWTVSDTENGTYTAISGAIASTFTLTQAEVDKFIKVVASYTDAQGTVEIVTSAASSAVDNTNDVGAIAAISGTTTQGQTLTAGAITDADGTTGGSSVAATYQWTVSDTENGTYTAISGAIASTFTLTQAEVDKFIKVVASYTDAQGTVETVTSAASSAVDNTNDVGAIAAISGTTTQGQTLTAGAITDADGTTGGSSVAATYQWTVSDTENGTYTAISGAIASTFTLTQAEVDKFIKVVASYTDAQGTVETVTSAASSAVDNTNDVGAIAAISGTTTQGQTLTAGAITDADGTTGGSSVAATYQWTVSDTENGTYTAISGAIASTFTLTQAEVDKFIKVVASYTDAQGTVETVTSAASSAVDNTNDVGAIAAISGTTTQGQTLTAGAITDADGTTGGSSVAATYQWTVSDTENGTYTAISGAIASTFTLTQAEVDKFIKVVASYTDAQGTVETVTSAASSAVDNTNDVGAIAAISGTTTQGQTLAAGAITDADGTTGGSSVAATYQWTVSDTENGTYTAISGAIASTFTLTQAEVDKFIKVVASYTDAQGTVETVTSAASSAVDNTNDVGAIAAISGTTTQGQTLTAGAITDADGTTGGSSVAATYQWTVSDTENGTYTAISGAIASTFTLTQAEVDKFIKVVASYTDAQGTVETVTSAASSAVDNTNDVGAIAAISGTTTQGQTLTAGAITDADGTTGGSSVAATYQWTVSDTENGTYTAISGAIASTFTLTQAEVDKFIKVVASYTDAQGTVETVTSAASSAVDNTNDVGAIAAISGTTTQGQTLTAGAITDADGTTGGSSVAATYQWTVSDTENGTYTAISGAIASTFTLTQAEVDKFIKVVASYTDAQGTVETVTSAASSAVDNTNDVGAIAAISGTTTQGQTLTAGAITDADGTTGGSSVAATYQWTVSDTENGTYTAISGAIASTFTLTQAEVDKFIKVVASYTDAQGTVETVTSAASSAVDNTNDVGAIAAISGTTTQGQTLTAGAITDADGTTGGSSVAATYQWTVSDTENGTYTAISGAIASTFTLTQAEVDKFIKVVASYTDAQGTVETVTSAASSAVDNTNDVGAIAAISGTTTQGQTLAAGAITDADGTTGGSSVAATYQWTVSDTENGTYTAISGAIASTFTLTQAEVDKFIKVVASYTDAQGTVETVTSAASSAVDNTNDVGAIAAISGTTTQGQTLTAGAITDADGTTGGSSVAATYQWTVSDTENGTYTAISGAIASTFTLTQAEVDKFIKVVASYTDAQGTVETVTSAASSAVDNTNDVGAIAAISGTTTQGQTLTAGAITDADGTTGGSSVAATYQWTVSDTENGTYTAISGAIASTFTLTQAEVDKFIKVVASYTDAQGTVETVTSAASSAVDNTNDVGAIAAISGTTTQGQTLTAGAITDADGTTGGSSVAATYQWTVSDTENGTYTAISGAIASTFTLTQAEVDKFIKVVASYTDAQGTVEIVTSAASSAVDNTNDVGAIAAISGTTTQGQTLAAGAITDADGTTGGSSVAATYQWTVSDTENGTYTAISGAIASTFTLTQAEVDKFIKVVASYTDAQGTVEIVTSAASSAVDNTNDVGAIAAISGTTTQGQTLTAGAITDADGTTGGSSVAATYQWTVSDTENGTYTAISGAIASTFTLTQAEVDKFIKVVASYTDAQGTVEIVTSAASSAVDNTNDVGAIAAISGTTTQGQTLTAGAITDADGTTGGSSVAATYQWTVSDTENGTYTAISGAIASTFTLTQAEVDKFIKVVASYTDAQGTVEIVTSAASSAVDNTNDVGAIAAISGTTTQGQTLTAGAITDADGTTGGSSVAATYQWTVSDTENGTYTAISGAIASTFTLTQAEVDKFIKVVASYTDAQGTVETVTSAASSAVDNTNDVGAIAAISGTTTQGQTLAAGAITDADGTTGGSSVAATYQWTVSDTENGTYTAISGAIASTFTLTQAEVDKFIKVVASYTDAQGTVETVTSAASSAVDNTNDVGAIAAISGTTTQGQTLTAGAITDADGTTGGSSVAATYQWTVSDTENGTYTAISGAIASTFTLTQAEVDKFIKVVASYTDAQGTVEIVTSAASSAVDNTNDVGAIAAISGTTTQGQTLAAGAITDADGTTGGSSVAATYQWTVSDTENGTYTAISGAIASTFTLTQAEVDKFIKVVASYTDAQGTVEIVTSAASSAVDNTNDVGAIAAISGTTTQGQTLTAGAITDADGTTGGSSVAATYQWTVSDTENGTYTAISGAIASTFTLTQAEVDKFIKVVASYTDAQGTVEIVTSAASSAVDNTNDVGAIAAISGTTTQGQTLAAGAITDADGTTGGSSVAATYQWTVSDTENGTYTAISGAIASTFTLTQAEVDKFIKVVASYTDAQGTVETVTSAASSAVDNTNDVGAIAAISGTTTQGQTLAAGAITDADGTTGGSSVAATYQWMVSDTAGGSYTAISGATTSTFTLTQAEVGKFIKVVASYTDAQGTSETVTSAASSAVTIDTVAPTIAITSYVSALKAGETAMITFTLSEVSTDFVAADVTVTGGVLSGFALKSGETKVYTATFTPTVGGSSGAISVANSKFTDAAGNNNADGSDADNSVSLTIDTVAPTIAITSYVSALKAGETAMITFTLSEVSTDFVAADVTVTGGMLSGFALKSGETKVYTATFTPTADSTTDGSVSVASSKFTDAVGNNNADGSDTNNTITMSIDSVRPILNSIVMSDTALLAGETSTVTFTFSEALGAKQAIDAVIRSTSWNTWSTSGKAADVVIASLDNFVSSSKGTAYSNDHIVKSNALENTWIIGGSGTGLARYLVVTLQDKSDGSGVEYQSYFIYDRNTASGHANRVATLATTSNFISAGWKDGNAYYAASGLNVSTFDIADITASNGTISNLSIDNSDDKIYTATFTPTTDMRADNNVITVNTNWTDVANNAPESSKNSANYVVNTVAPTIAITSDVSVLKAGETAMITFTLSKVSTDFVASDVTVTGGVLSGFALKSGETKVYTATFTPTADSTTDGSVSVASSKFTDAAGNNNADGSDTNNTITMSIDSVHPILNSIVMSDTALLAGETSTVTFTFSEALGAKQAIDAVIRSTSWNTWSTSGKAADVIITSLDNFVNSDNGIVYSNDHIVKSNVLENTWIIGGSGTGLARYLVVTLQDKSDGSGVEYQSYFIYSLERTSGHANRVATLATTSNFISAGWGDGNAFYAASGLNVSTFDITDITASNGTISNLSIDNSDDKIYTVTFTPTTDMSADNNVITVNTNWTDVANNAPESSKNSANYVIDTITPTIESAAVSGNTVTITFDEYLNTLAVPDASAFSVDVGGSRNVTGVAIGDKNVVLTIDGAAIVDGNTVNVNYTKPASGIVLEGTQGNDAVSLSNLIVGTSGVNTITGTSGNDIIIANAGADTLTGNGGVDTFDYNSTTDGNDTISDFVIGSGGDKLDLSDLLTGETSGTLANFIEVTDSNGAADGGDITLKIDADGGSSFTSPDIAITLTGAGITGAESTLASLTTDNIVIG